MAMTKHGVPIKDKPKYDPMKYTPKQIMEMEKRDGVKPTTVQPGQKLNDDGTYQTKDTPDDSKADTTHTNENGQQVGKTERTSTDTKMESKTTVL